MISGSCTDAITALCRHACVDRRKESAAPVAFDTVAIGRVELRSANACTALYVRGCAL
jgi:hypothetical protein